MRNGERFPKTELAHDWEHQQIQCPAGFQIHYEPGGTVHLPTGICGAYPLRERCTSSKRWRSASVHPEETLLEELRSRRLRPSGRQQLRERIGVEHSLAHIGH